MKVIINTCYGGYSISEAAVYALAERKGLTLYPEESVGGLKIYWIVPKSERPKKIVGHSWMNMPLEERQAYNEAYRALTLSNRPEDRTDSDLIAVVEELGAAASGGLASLKIVEIPDDVEWTIEEYDGIEWVAEVHRTWN